MSKGKRLRKDENLDGEGFSFFFSHIHTHNCIYVCAIVFRQEVTSK